MLRDTVPDTATRPIEVSVLPAGWALGGTVGAGTVAFALLIGPAVSAALRDAGPHRTRNGAPRA
jgi:uncharacterized membrane protein YczE